MGETLNQLTFKDINGLVEQNVQLRSLLRSLSDQVESTEMEFKVVQKKILCHLFFGKMVLFLVDNIVSSMHTDYRKSLKWSLKNILMNLPLKLLLSYKEQRSKGE